MIDKIYQTAIRAYNKAYEAPASGIESEAPAKVNFAQILGKSFKEAQASLHKADSAAIQAVNGSNKIDMTTLVTTINEAEVTLQAVVAIRDKIISSYQDIMRMQV